MASYIFAATIASATMERWQGAKNSYARNFTFRSDSSSVPGGSASNSLAITMIGVSIALVLLFGLVTLVSYVDRLTQEIGKFLSREFQNNIDAFEQIIEPRLGVTRERASLSMAILTQLVTAAIAMIVGFTVFRDRAWSIDEVLKPTVSLILIIIIWNRLRPFACCTEPHDVTHDAWP